MYICRARDCQGEHGIIGAAIINGKGGNCDEGLLEVAQSPPAPLACERGGGGGDRGTWQRLAGQMKGCCNKYYQAVVVLIGGFGITTRGGD